MACASSYPVVILVKRQLQFCSSDKQRSKYTSRNCEIVGVFMYQDSVLLSDLNLLNRQNLLINKYIHYLSYFLTHGLVPHSSKCPRDLPGSKCCDTLNLGIKFWSMSMKTALTNNCKSQNLEPSYHSITGYPVPISKRFHSTYMIKTVKGKTFFTLSFPTWFRTLRLSKGRPNKYSASNPIKFENETRRY